MWWQMTAVPVTQETGEGGSLSKPMSLRQDCLKL
jgi:hypothetical protein